MEGRSTPTFDVEPLRGVGPVRLGMTRDESRAAMGLPFESFQKSPGDAALTDAYLDSSFQVFFDREDRVDFIELSAGPDCVALYRGTPVLELPAEEAVALLARDAAPDLSEPEDETSVVFPALELSLWRPFAPDDEGDDPFDDDEDWSDSGYEPIELEPEEQGYDGRTYATIGVGKRGYFSSRSA